MAFGHIPALLATGFFLFGVLFVVFGARTLSSDARRRRTWTRLPGQVVARRSDGEQVRCQVAYQLPDRKVLFWNRYTSTMLRNPVGRPVQVLVNPADPHDAVVDSGLVGGTLVGTVFIVIGGVLALVGAAIGAVLIFVL